MVALNFLSIHGIWKDCAVLDRWRWSPEDVNIMVTGITGSSAAPTTATSQQKFAFQFAVENGGQIKESEENEPTDQGANHQDDQA
jgi:hypothetical protein